METYQKRSAISTNAHRFVRKLRPIAMTPQIIGVERDMMAVWPGAVTRV